MIDFDNLKVGHVLCPKVPNYVIMQFKGVGTLKIKLVKTQKWVVDAPDFLGNVAIHYGHLEIRANHGFLEENFEQKFNSNGNPVVGKPIAF